MRWALWWEIVEFTVDKVLDKNTQYSLDNTMWVLVHNFFGSLFAAGLGWLYVRFTRPSERRRLARPLARLLRSVPALTVPDHSE